MANWFRTVITAPEYVIKAMINNENNIDFEMILPLNKEQNIFEEWGTPTNACDSKYDITRGIARFDTKYSCPYEILMKLSERFPNDVIRVVSECDAGDDWRIFDLENGEIVSKRLKFDEPYSLPSLWERENNELLPAYWETKLKEKNLTHRKKSEKSERK